MALVPTIVFGPLVAPTLPNLDTNFNQFATWVNARNPTVGPIASRPAAGNAGAIWVASDQSNLTYVDDGATWQLIVDVTVPPGQCRLIKSGAVLQLSPYNGNRLPFPTAPPASIA